MPDIALLPKIVLYFGVSMDTLFSMDEESYDKSPSPKWMDSLYARAFLFEKMNRTDDAVSMWECIIQTLGRDYDISSGESVDWAQREIARLKSIT